MVRVSVPKKAWGNFRTWVLAPSAELTAWLPSEWPGLQVQRGVMLPQCCWWIPGWGRTGAEHWAGFAPASVPEHQGDGPGAPSASSPSPPDDAPSRCPTPCRQREEFFRLKSHQSYFWKKEAVSNVKGLNSEAIMGIFGSAGISINALPSWRRPNRWLCASESPKLLPDQPIWSPNRSCSPRSFNCVYIRLERNKGKSSV